MLWAVFTVIAAAAQTARNAMQRELTATLGTVGATHVRFLFGFPFAVIFLIGVCIATESALPHPPLVYWPWIVLGFAAQIAATAMMLSAMSDRSFVTTIAYIKTEPVQVALFGLVLLGDRVTPLLALAILIATAGVVVMSLKPGAVQAGGFRPTLVGLLSGGMFGLSAIGYRGAILSLGLHDNFVLAATFTLTVGLIFQAALLSAWLAWRDPKILKAIFREWKPSLFAGFMGALASQFWFLGFAIATAASVRTLALVEVLFAQAISKLIFKQPTSPREIVGILMIVAGVVLLIWAH
ncbi:MAG TPA: DMT family transporter [Pseudolabrys sp.]|nr:DMT family transporter [Pseudolabrys sp.]